MASLIRLLLKKITGGGYTPGVDRLALEGGSGLLLLEDGTSFLLLE